MAPLSFLLATVLCPPAFLLFMTFCTADHVCPKAENAPRVFCSVQASRTHPLFNGHAMPRPSLPRGLQFPFLLDSPTCNSLHPIFQPQQMPSHLPRSKLQLIFLMLCCFPSPLPSPFPSLTSFLPLITLLFSQIESVVTMMLYEKSLCWHRIVSWCV